MSQQPAKSAEHPEAAAGKQQAGRRWCRGQEGTGIPDKQMEESFIPEIVLLYCGHSLAEGEYLPEGARRYDGHRARFVMIPCSQKVEVGYLLGLIEQGAEGVTLVVCPQEECRSVIGSARAKNRVRYARSLLEEVGIPGDRLRVAQGHALAADRVMALAEEQAGVVRPLGANPMRRASAASR